MPLAVCFATAFLIFKLNKRIIDRRLGLFVDEGMIFKTNVNVGVDVTKEELLNEFDAVVLAMGAEQPRNLEIEGRDLDGVHFAMDFLMQQNKVVAGQEIPVNERILAEDKNVLVIGGGDTRVRLCRYICSPESQIGYPD